VFVRFVRCLLAEHKHGSVEFLLCRHAPHGTLQRKCTVSSIKANFNLNCVMASAYHSFSPLGSAGDSNTEHMHRRFVSTAATVFPIHILFIVLTDANGAQVCTTRMRNGQADKTFNMPALTPCHNAAHYSRAMQVYHERHMHLVDYDVALRLYKITAPLIPQPVLEDAGAD